MLMSKKKWRRGVTLTELLVVLAIIGLLATIAVPVYVNKMEQAKVTTAKHEVRELASAEEVCGIMHGYYVPLNMLDDLPIRLLNRPPSVDDIENTRNILNCYLINTGIPIRDQDTNQQRLQNYSSTKSVSNMYYGWQGPFMNFKRYYLGDGVYVEPPDPLPEDMARDYPLDPWGNPYIIVTEQGYVSPIGRITSTLLPPSRYFDRMAIISLGPDGSVQNMTDDSLNITNITAEDDIWVYFGSSGLRPETYY